MTPLGLDTAVATGILTAMWFAVVIRIVVGGWQGITLPARMPAWWPLGEAAWRGQRRATYVVIPFSGSFIVTAWLALANSYGLVPPIVPVLSSGVVLILMFIMLSITLFNRPRFAVPRGMWSERGAIEGRFPPEKQRP